MHDTYFKAISELFAQYLSEDHRYILAAKLNNLRMEPAKTGEMSIELKNKINWLTQVLMSKTRV